MNHQEERKMEIKSVAGLRKIEKLILINIILGLG